jgi:hypothetical protein
MSGWPARRGRIRRSREIGACGTAVLMFPATGSVGHSPSHRPDPATYLFCFVRRRRQATGPAATSLPSAPHRLTAPASHAVGLEHAIHRERDDLSQQAIALEREHEIGPMIARRIVDGTHLRGVPNTTLPEPSIVVAIRTR